MYFSKDHARVNENTVDNKDLIDASIGDVMMVKLRLYLDQT